MALNDNDPGNTDTDNNPCNNHASEQNPVRLTIGNYYCSNCGEGGLSRSDPRCPSCQAYLRWNRVAI